MAALAPVQALLWIVLLAGNGISIAHVPLLILTVGKVPEVVNIVLSRVLLGVDRPDLAARAVVALLVVNLTLNPLLIPVFGLSGAAAATTLSFGVHAVLVVYYVSRFIEIRLDYRTVGASVGAALAMGSVLAVLQTRFAAETLPALVALIGIGAVLYFVFLFAFPSVRHRILEVL